MSLFVVSAQALANNTPQWSDWQTTIISTGAHDFRPLAINDIDGDGDIDFAAGKSTFFWFENDGNGSFSQHSLTSSSFLQNAIAIDIDGVNGVDIIASDFSSGAVYWYQNDGNQNFTRQIFPTDIAAPGGTTSVKVLDIDGDTDLDAYAVRQNGRDVVYWYDNDGSGGFTQKIAFDFGENDALFKIATGKMDNDLIPDLIMSQYSVDADGTIYPDLFWVKSNGDGTFDSTVNSIDVAGGSYSGFGAIFTAADIDDDGDDDIAASVQGEDKLLWYENDGNGNFTAHEIANLGEDSRSARIIDIDGDGDKDLLVSSASKATIYYNDGSENFSATTIVTGGSGVREFQAAKVVQGADNAFIVTYEAGQKVELIKQLKAFSHNENSGVVGILTATDPDADSIVYSITGGADAAKFSIDASSGELTFNSAPDFENPTDNDTDNVYKIIVGANDGSVTAKMEVEVTVNDVNDEPVIAEGATTSVVMSENGTPTAFSLTLNAVDEDGDTITWSISSNASNGNASASGTGASKVINYSPNPNYSGLDSFTVQVSDGNGGIDTITVNVTVNNVNVLPTANSLFYTLPEDGSIAVILSGTDSDGSIVNYLVNSPTNGVLSGTAPNLTYTPNADFNGNDSFTYSVEDNDGGTSSLATVTITVTSVNDLPVATAQSLTIDEDTTTSITLSGTDIDGSIANYLVDNPTNGVLSGVAPHFTYTPEADFNGIDSFTFRVQDNDGGISSLATVSITITSVNDLPIAIAQSITIDEETNSSITLSGTDSDGSIVNYLVNSPTNGVLSGTAPNLTYTPNADFNGNDSFTYSVEDNDGGTSSLATVTITVSSVNDLPVATVQSLTIDEDTTTSITLSGTDIDGSIANYLVDNPANGVLSGVAPHFTYTPEADFNGIDSFTFRVQDNDGGISSSALISITVNAVDDLPVSTGELLLAALSEDLAGGEVFTLAQLTTNIEDVDADPIALADQSYTGTYGYLFKGVNDQWRYKYKHQLSDEEATLLGVDANSENLGLVETLAEGQQVQESFPLVFYSQGKSIADTRGIQQVLINITGVDDSPTSSGAIVLAELDEDNDTGMQFNTEQLTANLLDIEGDPIALVNKTYIGKYGYLFIDSTGQWRYQFKHKLSPEDQEIIEIDYGQDNALLDDDLVETLLEGQAVQESILLEFYTEGLEPADTFPINVNEEYDQTRQELLFNIIGVNDIPASDALVFDEESQSYTVNIFLEQKELINFEFIDVDDGDEPRYELSGTDAEFLAIDSQGMFSIKTPLTLEGLKAQTVKTRYQVDLTVSDNETSNEYPITFILSDTLDLDGDGVYDEDEKRQGTDPYDNTDYLDSDGDGVSDSLEVIQETDPNDPDSFLDTDGDQIPDYQELLDGTSATDPFDSKDSDSDGVPDRIEIAEGTNINDASDFVDSDSDGVADYLEIMQGTDTHDEYSYRDTDGDKVPDQVEIIDGTDLEDENSFVDTDKDGFADYEENLYGSDPNNRESTPEDSDGDKVPDFQEAIDGTNPFDNTSYKDTDGDGVADFVEGVDGTDPVDNRSYLDLDGDLVSDSREVLDDTDQTDKFSYLDGDGDGVADYAELLEGTDPNNNQDFIDTDGDGVSNYVEMLLGTDPNTPEPTITDTDSDGVSDLDELEQGTDPTDANSFLDTDEDGVPDAVELSQQTEIDDAASFLDTDGDGIADYIEIRQGTNPSDENNFLDSDGDGVSDQSEIAQGTSPTDSNSYLDTDTDGIPDDVEIRAGLNPEDETDAEGDLDSDGISNLDEYLLGTDIDVDSVAPELTLDEEIWVNAISFTTSVDEFNLSNYGAYDGVDGELTLNWSQETFTSGRFEVNVYVEDAAGNRTEQDVTLNVRPLIGFKNNIINAKTSEGNKHVITLALSGVAPSYPIVVPYYVSGTADFESDHNLSAGEFIFNEGEVESSISFNTVLDSDVEADEVIEVILDEATALNFSFDTKYSLTVTESNLAPRVSGLVKQNDINSNWVVGESGEVQVAITIEDANIEDSHVVEWFASDLIVLQSSSDTKVTFDPSVLPQGSYRISAKVTDNGLPAKSSLFVRDIVVKERLPILSSDSDSDGDSVPDDEEGMKDSDGDNIPDYLDNLYLHSYQVAVRAAEQPRIAESTLGTQIIPGTLALPTGGLAVENTDMVNQSEFELVSDLFDFEVVNLADTTSVDVVIPLGKQIPTNANYRKLDENMNWTDFVLDDHNKVKSALSLGVSCPEAGSDLYEDGLVFGYTCLQLTIEDGGPNDDDGEINQRVVDPGAITILKPESEPDPEPEPEPETPKRKGGGSNAVFLFFLLCLIGANRIATNRLN